VASDISPTGLDMGVQASADTPDQKALDIRATVSVVVDNQENVSVVDNQENVSVVDNQENVASVDNRAMASADRKPGP